MTFSVWFRLAEMLAKIKDKPTEERFKPYVSQLIKSLVKHCQLNDDLAHVRGSVHTHFLFIVSSFLQDEIFNEKDDFFDFRENASEVVKDIVFVVGAVECFQSVGVACDRLTISLFSFTT